MKEERKNGPGRRRCRRRSFCEKEVERAFSRFTRSAAAGCLGWRPGSKAWWVIDTAATAGLIMQLLSAQAGAEDGSSKRRRKADLKRRLTKWLVAGWVKQGSVCAACPGNVRPRDSRIENPPQITVTRLIDCADPSRQSAARRALARQRGSRHQQAREDGVGGVGVRRERAVAQECANPYLPLPATIRVMRHHGHRHR